MRNKFLLFCVLIFLILCSCASSSKTGEDESEVSVQDEADALAAALSAEEQFIIEAVSAGNCIALYNYTEQGKDKTDPKLLLRAGTALKRYTAADSAAAKYRTNKMDPRVRRVPKNIMDRVFVEPETAIALVVQNLVSGFSDPYGKAKAIHDWICDNIAFDAELYYTGRNRNQDYLSVLKKRAALGAGYANLFFGMCKLANLEAISIRGYSKGFAYQGALGKNPDHEWNAVKINGKWYLADLSIDSGYLDGGTFIKRYSTAGLFPDSRSFLYSHLPEKAEQQFYAPVLSAETFQKEAYLPGAFFQYGLELKTPDEPGYNNRISGPLKVDIISRSANVLLSAELRTPDYKTIEGAVWQEKNNNTFSFYFDLPVGGEYKGLILAQRKNEKRIQERIGVGSFETVLLPRIDKLLADKRINTQEADYYKNAYVKIEENGLYYYKEDQLNTPSNNAIIKIQDMIGVASSSADTALEFSISAAGAYSGFGSGRKFPLALPALKEAAGTRIISPLEGELEAGSTVQFSLNTRDYTRIVIMEGEEIVSFSRPNPASNFELSYAIQADQKEIQISGSRDGKTYTPLVKYFVKPGA